MPRELPGLSQKTLGLPILTLFRYALGQPGNLLQSIFFAQITDSSVAGVYFGVGTGRTSDMAVRQSMAIVSGAFLLDLEVI